MPTLIVLPSPLLRSSGQERQRDSGRPRTRSTEEHVLDSHPPNPRLELGRAGESAAARYLEAQGYRIVARNVRADRVEIDLIARRGPLVVFVEVKARRGRGWGSAAEAVDDRKQRRLRRGAGAWLAGRPPEARGVRRTRFDVVTCTPDPDRAARQTKPVIRAGPDESISQNETTALNGVRWLIEHWKAAF